MKTTFDHIPYPGRPKILFIGLAASSHTHSWINLLAKSKFNVRLFALPQGGLPPHNWVVKTYIPIEVSQKLNPGTRKCLFPLNKISRLLKKRFAYHIIGGIEELQYRWLAQIIWNWQPDIIHTFGINPSGYFYFHIRQKFHLASIGKWVVQIRGGSDLALARFDPEASKKIRQILCESDQIITDNPLNVTLIMTMGVEQKQIAQLTPVSGVGGIDIVSLAQSWQGSPSTRRIILWPKAYDCPWSMALPVFEALKLVWDDIQPCRIYMFAMIPATQMWYWELPEKIRQYCYAEERVPRERILQLMTKARIMLAPSLVDGIPNSLLEAMAAGAFPIVSPLETIRTVVKNEYNVLFARNLYPYEIAEALKRAMSDDELIDRAAERNLKRVREIADRATISQKVIRYYEELSGK